PVPRRRVDGPSPMPRQRDDSPPPVPLQQDDGPPENTVVLPCLKSMTWVMENKTSSPENKVAVINLKLQDYSKSPSSEYEVKFHLSRGTVGPVLQSMTEVSEQLSTTANKVAVINLKILWLCAYHAMLLKAADAAAIAARSDIPRRTSALRMGKAAGAGLLQVAERVRCGSTRLSFTYSANRRLLFVVSQLCLHRKLQRKEMKNEEEKEERRR
ncbi:protein FAR1-related sequence 3-like, partial [Trifolium pratense]